MRGMQIVKKATVRKMVVDGTLYGRIQCVVPGWLVGKEVMVIIWTEPTIEEATLRKKGVKLWRQDEHGNILEVVPENVKLKPKAKKEEKPVEAKPVEKPIEEIEVKPEEVEPEVKTGEKPEVKPGVMELLERIRKEQELKRFLEEYGKKRLGVENV
jgi:hypothetical protein